MHFPKAFLSLTEQVKEKPDKGPEHLHGKVSFATKLANAGSDSGGGGGAKKHGKGGKKGGPDLSKYAGLPDDISLGNLPKVCGAKSSNCASPKKKI
jgi:hypothetical protein